MKPRRQKNGAEFWGPTYTSELERVASECGPIAGLLWAWICAWAGTRERLEAEHAPSIVDLARRLNVNRSSIQGSLPKLEAVGLLRLERLPGRKPTWILRPGVEPPNLPAWPAGSDTPTPVQGPAPPAALAGNPRRSGRQLLPANPAPVPPREIESERRERVGDDELRKTKLEQEEQEVLRPLVQHVASGVAMLQQADPDSLDAAVIDELAESARDLSDWRALGQIASEATARLPPRIHPGAATPPPGGPRVLEPTPTGPRP